MAQDIRFTWQINPEAEVADEGDRKSVIKSVSWALVARRWIDDKPTADFDSLSGSTAFGTVGADFKEFDAVTPEDVVKWSEAIIGTEQLEKWKNVLTERIEAMPIVTTRKAALFEKLSEKKE